MCISVTLFVTVFPTLSSSSPTLALDRSFRLGNTPWVWKTLTVPKARYPEWLMSSRVDHHHQFLLRKDPQGDNHTVHLDRVFLIPLRLFCHIYTRTGWQWLTDLEELPYVPPLSATELCCTLFGPQPRMDGGRIGQLVVHLARCLVIGLTDVSAGQS